MISEKTDILEPIYFTDESVQVSGTPTNVNIPPQDSKPSVNSDSDEDLSNSRTSEESHQPESLAIQETELTNSEQPKHLNLSETASTTSEISADIVDSETPSLVSNLESEVISNTESFSKTGVESGSESSSITTNEEESRSESSSKISTEVESRNLETGLASETLKNPDSSNIEVQAVATENLVPEISIDTVLAPETLKNPDSSNIYVQENGPVNENHIPDISNQPEEQQTQSGSQDETSNVQARTQDPSQEADLQNLFNNLVDEPKEDSFISDSNVKESQTVHDLFIGDAETQNDFAEISNDSILAPNSQIDDLRAQAFPSQDFEGVLTNEEKTGLEEVVSSITAEQFQEENDPVFYKIDEDNGPFGSTTNPRFSRKRRSVIIEVCGHSLMTSRNSDYFLPPPLTTLKAS